MKKAIWWKFDYRDGRRRRAKCCRFHSFLFLLKFGKFDAFLYNFWFKRQFLWNRSILAKNFQISSPKKWCFVIFVPKIDQMSVLQSFLWMFVRNSGFESKGILSWFEFIFNLNWLSQLSGSWIQIFTSKFTLGAITSNIEWKIHTHNKKNVENVVVDWLSLLFWPWTF